MSTLDQIDEQPRRSWLTGKRLVGIAIAVLIVLRIGIDLIPIRVQIGPETTVIDSPLREDGTPDYAAYLNEKWADGVTPEENAVIDLMRAFGPGIINEETREAYFEQLRIPMPPLEGDYLTSFEQSLLNAGMSRQTDGEELERLSHQASEAQTQAWSPEEFPELAAWLEVNKEPFEHILEASRSPRYFSPLIVPSDVGLLNTSLSTTQHTREAVRLIMRQAMLELEEGNIEEALKLTLACHRISRLVGEHPTLIGHLVAYALSAMASAGDEAIILSGNLTTEQATAHRVLLAELRPFQPIAETIDQGERFMSLDAVISMHSGRLTEEDLGNRFALKLGFDPNPGMYRFNQFYDELTTAMKQPDRLQRLHELHAIERSLDATPRQDYGHMLLRMLIGTRRAVSETVGNMLVQLLAPGVMQSVTAEDRAQIRAQLVDIGYALAASRPETGSYPESLDALVPEYLEAVPIDPFSGNEIRYQLTETGFLLWNIGHDQMDDGGSNEHGADDISFGDRPTQDE